MKYGDSVGPNMRSTRRALLAGVGTGAAATLAGCTGQLTATGVAFEASEAPLPRGTQEETGYTHYRTDTSTVSRRFERFGVGRTVDVTNVVSEYDRAVEVGLVGRRIRAAVFATLATPKVRILGREFNPVVGMSTTELAEMIQQRYDGFRVHDVADSFEAAVAGGRATVTRFEAEARLIAADLSVDVHLYLSEAVDAGGDFVLGLAVHPRAFGRQESTVRELLAAVEPA